MHALLARATTIPFCRVALRNAKSVSTRRGASVVTMSARKGGVASDEEFDAFVSKNDGKTIFVVDARNPDFSVEPDDETFGGPSGSAPITDGAVKGECVRRIHRVRRHLATGRRRDLRAYSHVVTVQHVQHEACAA